MEARDRQLKTQALLITQHICNNCDVQGEENNIIDSVYTVLVAMTTWEEDIKMEKLIEFLHINTTVDFKEPELTEDIK